MKITYEYLDGEFHAFYKFSERVFCLSTADTLREAIDGCCELIEARRKDLKMLKGENKFG